MQRSARSTGTQRPARVMGALSAGRRHQQPRVVVVVVAAAAARMVQGYARAVASDAQGLPVADWLQLLWAAKGPICLIACPGAMLCPVATTLKCLCSEHVCKACEVR